MSEKNLPEDRLNLLNLELERDFQEAIDLNTDVINATRTMAHKLLVIRNAHLQQADRIFQMVSNLAESAALTADLTADIVSAEWGISEVFVDSDGNIVDFSDVEDDEDDE